MLNLLPLPDRKEGIDLSDYCDAAARLGCDVSMIRAVDAVESAGRGFLASGRPKILFEAHLFHKFTGGKYTASHPYISSRKWNRSLYVGGEGEYRRLEAAMKLDASAALRAASWSRFQILGDNFHLCGYRSVEEFVEDMFRDEDNSLESFVQFMVSTGLRNAMRRKDAAAVARGYNGPGYKRNEYDVKIRNAEKAFAKFKIECRGANRPAPTPIDVALPAVCHGTCVGLNNTSLDDRYLTPTDESVSSGGSSSETERPTPTSPTAPPSRDPDESSTSDQNDPNRTNPAGPPTPGGTAASTPSLSGFFDKLMVKVGNLSDFLDKIDLLKGTAGRLRGLGADKLKQVATNLTRLLVKAVVFLVALLSGLPTWVLVLLSVVIIVSMVYMLSPRFRALVLGVVKRRN